MKKIAVLLVLALAFFLQSMPALADTEEEEHVNYIRDVFNEDKGLLTGEANVVLQASNGYLWIGSYSGLVRYDGSTMMDFSSRMETSAVRALMEGSNGVLYIGTNGAGAYRMEGDVFTHITGDDPRSFLTVRGFAEGRDGTVYMASPSGIARIERGRLEPIAHEELNGLHFLSAAVDGNGNLWTLTDGGELLVMNDKHVLGRFSSDDFFSDESVYSLCSGRDGSLFIGSTGSSILELQVEQGADYLNPDSIARKTFSAGELHTINCLNPAADGTILVCAMNGFGYLDEAGRFHLVEQDAMNSMSANWAALDYEGNRWVASTNYGVIRYSLGCFDSCNFNSELGSYTVNAVARQGDLFYLGTDGGLLVFDRNWKPVETEIGALLDGIRIRNITVDTAGRVWMATYSSHGALCYDPATGETWDFGAAEGLNSEKVRVVYALSDGRMLVGNQNGVNIIENGAISASYGADDGMTTTSVLCAMEQDGRIYVGTDGNGIYEITGEGLVNLSFDQGLSEGVVLRMEPDADNPGCFFVCASDKLFYWEGSGFRQLTGMQLDNGSLFALYDVGGRLWILQNGGVSSADKAAILAGEESYTAHYGVKCGMTGTLNANTWNWLEEDGSLYIPTRSGVSIFHFRGPEVSMPRAILNSVTVDGVSYEHPEEMTLPADTHRLTIDISLLLFSETTEYTLAYRLDGFDEGEAYTRDKHVSVSYTNLPGGIYTLRMRVIDPLTGEDRVEQSTVIVKEKKISEHAWFYVLCFLLLAAAVGTIIRLTLRHQARKLMKKQEEQRHYIDEITKVFSSCVDMRDHYTNGHSARVARYTAMLAEKLGKSREEVDRMYHIALLHDVGKISIPDAVLNKPGKLTDEEYQLMRSHAQRGYDVLKDMDIDQDLSLGAGCHHERYDGKGYPRGLKGEEIPEVARIIAVADTFDAMYSTRPYRKQMELSTVVEEIRRGSGTQFSPDVVEAFLQLYQEGAFGKQPQAQQA